MTLSAALHILVVEDHDSLRSATIDFLRGRGHHASGVSCAEDVVDTPARDVPDLYLIDVNLPGENGFELARRIRRSQPDAGIVLMTARGQLNDRLEGYTCGADHYLVKPVEPPELLACIQSLARRLKPVSPGRADHLVLYRHAARLVGPAGESSLSHTEGLLLVAFCLSAGHKLERWQVMQVLDTKGKELTSATMEMRISRLRKKLVACGAPPEAIRSVRGFGYGLNCLIEVQ